MNFTAVEKSGVLFLIVEGEVDEHGAGELRLAADRKIDEHAGADKAVFDLGKVSFMDSTGIGFLIGRYKKLRRYGIPSYVSRVNAETDKILSLSGVYSLIPKM
ncbi:MAG: STAS domain-containing protein [Clostridia bacterium]|nr:STAS domain-containing protein [Clostridia bacterium]